MIRCKTRRQFTCAIPALRRFTFKVYRFIKGCDINRVRVFIKSSSFQKVLPSAFKSATDFHIKIAVLAFLADH